MVEVIDVRSLIRLYRRKFGVDVAAELFRVGTLSLRSCEDCDLVFFDPPVAGTERFYDALQRYDWYYMEDKHEFEQARQYVRSTDRVLEVGCGKGVFGKHLRTTNYIGLELSEEARRRAVEAGLHVLKESVEEHQRNNTGKYDVVCAFQVLEHVATVRSFIEACVSCLRPGGMLILTVPSASSFCKDISNFILNMPPHHITRWTDSALRNVAGLFGLEHVALSHEPLQPAHQELYRTTIFMNALRRAFRLKMSHFDDSLVTRTLWLTSRVGARLFAWGFRTSDLAVRGMSVTAVYRKKDQDTGGNGQG